MLVIRREQMEVFQAEARRTFEDAMVAHLAAFSPPLHRAVGDAALRSTVQLGMTRAAGYGFDQRGPVRLYLELMLLFGSRFDTDPQYPWASAILSDRDDGAPQMRRAERLYERTMDYRQRVAGPEDAYALRGLRNIRAWAAAPIDFAMSDLIPYMLREISALYPEKADYVGQEALAALIRKGREGALNQRFGSPRAIALVVVLMVAFGHGCGADPLYPWIARTLKEDAAADPETKAKRLEKRALTWLDAVLANLEPSTPT